MNNPEYIEIDGVKIKIHTDYRYALKCQEIASDNSISGYEKEIGIIYTLFDAEGINILHNDEKCLKMALKYLQGRPNKAKERMSKEKAEIDMDYHEDFGYIMSSMLSEYQIDITKEQIHWWVFLDLLNGLSSECIFNRIRDIRTRNVSDIKDPKMREELIRLKKIYSLDKRERILTDAEKESVENFYKLTGIKKED